MPRAIHKVPAVHVTGIEQALAQRPHKPFQRRLPFLRSGSRIRLAGTRSKRTLKELDEVRRERGEWKGVRGRLHLEVPSRATVRETVLLDGLGNQHVSSPQVPPEERMAIQEEEIEDKYSQTKAVVVHRPRNA